MLNRSYSFFLFARSVRATAPEIKTTISQAIVSFLFPGVPSSSSGRFPLTLISLNREYFVTLFLVCFDDRNVQILIESMIELWRHKRTRRIADALRARKNGILHLPLLIILDRVIIIRTPSFYQSLNLTLCAVSPTSPSWRLPNRSCWDRH